MTIGGKEYSIQDVMREPVLFAENATLKDALTEMVRRQTNSGLVVDTEGKLLGMVTTVDIIKAVLPDYLEEDEIAARFADESLLRQDALKSATLPIKDFMMEDVPTVPSDATLLEGAVMAVRGGYGRIAVVDENNKPVGVLTRTEIKRVIAGYLDIINDFS